MAGKRDKIKDSERFTILYPEFTGRCFICGSTDRVAKHEIFGGPFRDASKQEGLVVELCGSHHNLSSQGVHFNAALDLKLKKYAEKVWIKTNVGDNINEGIKKFIYKFGKNYLDDEDL